MPGCSIVSCRARKIKNQPELTLHRTLVKMSPDDMPDCLKNRYKQLNRLVQEIHMACEDEKAKHVHSFTSKPKSPTADESCCKVPICVVEESAPADTGTCCKAPDAENATCKDNAVGSLTLLPAEGSKWSSKIKFGEAQPKMCLEKCFAKCNSRRASGKKSKTRPISPSTQGRVKQSPKKHNCGASEARPNTPLRTALSNLKDAASFEKDCAVRMKELTTTQESLTEQIQKLEEKEKKGIALLKEADSMWSHMEEQYKKQLEDSKERTKTLQKELKELDAKSLQCRKVRKDLEFTMRNLDKNSQEVKEKTIQKENDIKILRMEIEGFKKRIASNAKDLETAKNSYKSKKEASDEKLRKINSEMQNLQNKIGEECQCKQNKEDEGCCYVKEARNDLQKICRCLLQKKLENEDLRAEKEAIIQEINLLKTTSDTCSERCARRQQNIAEETKRIDQEIANFQLKCTQCHRYTDSGDLTRYCVDCPRCLIKRECIVKGDECSTDHTKDCVCTRVKEKFLDNVFENMYSVLEKQTTSCTGKEVADCIFTCLEKSKNGKLDENTRKVVHDFILSTVKKNITLTIVGGAVKTRCEMDPETYGQLMLCLKDVAVTKPVKVDKGTIPKKPPCSRWNETSECNCPKGPKNCPCIKKAPKQSNEPGTCQQYGDEEDYDDEPWMKREPCEEKSCPTCPFGANMRAAQCMLGSEVLSRVQPYASHRSPPVVPGVTFMDTNATYVYGDKTATSHDDTDNAEQSRYRMIEGVMGRYSEVPPIEEMQFIGGTSYHYLKENLKLKSAFSRIPSDHNSTVAAYVSVDLRPSSCLQNPILLTDQANTHDDLNNRNILNQNETNEQSEIIQKYDNNQLNDQFIELSLAVSGKFNSDLDERTVKNIEELRITDKELLKPIKTTSLGVNFVANKTVIENSELETTRAKNLTTLLDMHRNIIKRDSLPLVNILKHSSNTFLLKNKQSNSKEVSLKLDTIVYANDREEKEKVNTKIGKEVIKDENKCSTKKEMSCSAVTITSENELKLIDSGRKAVATTDRAESNICCNDTYTNVRAQLLIDLDGTKVTVQQRCLYKFDDSSPDNTNTKQIGEVSRQSTSKDESEIAELFKAGLDFTAPKNEFKSKHLRPQLNSNASVSSELLEKVELWQAHAQKAKVIHFENKYGKTCNRASSIGLVK